MVFRPTTFGKYVLLKRIAIGGMAEVFRAKAFGAEGFEKVAAVKRMLPHLSSDNQFVDMFINEAKLAANLNHANIVQIYDFGCIDNLYFISMEYVQGKDIADIIRVLRERNLTTPLELACHLFIEVLNGLDYAHRLRDSYGDPLGLIHRDMSPHNVIVSYEGEVKLVDFGIAKAASSTVHTTGGVLKGKYSYMSPEQAHGMALDLRSDIFSLGICFYELLTLTKMFHAESDLGVLEKVRETDFPRPREVNESIPEELEEILLRALQKNPEDRYESAGEWRDQLERFLFGNNLHYSTSWLAGFMREIFGSEMDCELSEFADEAEVVQKLRSEARRAARLEGSEAPGPDTVVIKKGSDTSVEYLEDTVSGQETQEVESFAGDTFTEPPMPDDTDEPVELSDDEVMAIDEDDVEQIEDEEEVDEYVETAKLDRPDPNMFRKFAGDLKRKKRKSSRSSSRPAIREVPPPSADDTFTDSGAATDRKQKDSLNFLMDSTEPERSNSAARPLETGDFEKERSTIPEGELSLGLRGPSTTRDGEPMDDRSSGGFPFGILFAVLLVAVVGGGVAAFYFHSGNGEEGAGDGGADPALLAPVEDLKQADAGFAMAEDKGRPEPVPPDAGRPEAVVGADEGQPPPDSGKEAAVDETPASKEEDKGDEKKRDEKEKDEKEKVADSKKSDKRPGKRKRRTHKRRRRRKKRRRKVQARAPKEEKGFGKVDVGMAVSWAFVYVDGQKIRTTPLLNYRLKAGSHLIELKDQNGDLVRRWRIRVRADEKVKLLHQ